MPFRIESHVEALGSHVDDIEKSLVALELGRQGDKDRVSRLEANQAEFSRKLDSLIELLSPHHNRGEAIRLNGGGESSRANERESEVDNKGVWGQFFDRQTREVSNDSPIATIKI